MSNNADGSPLFSAKDNVFAEFLTIDVSDNADGSPLFSVDYNADGLCLSPQAFAVDVGGSSTSGSNDNNAPVSPLPPTQASPPTDLRLPLEGELLLSSPSQAGKPCYEESYGLGWLCLSREAPLEVRSLFPVHRLEVWMHGGSSPVRIFDLTEEKLDEQVDRVNINSNTVSLNVKKPQLLSKGLTLNPEGKKKKNYVPPIFWMRAVSNDQKEAVSRKFFVYIGALVTRDGSQDLKERGFEALASLPPDMVPAEAREMIIPLQLSMFWNCLKESGDPYDEKACKWKKQMVDIYKSTFLRTLGDYANRHNWWAGSDGWKEVERHLSNRSGLFVALPCFQVGKKSVYWLCLLKENTDTIQARLKAAILENSHPSSRENAKEVATGRSFYVSCRAMVRYMEQQTEDTDRPTLLSDPPADPKIPFSTS